MTSALAAGLWVGGSVVLAQAALSGLEPALAARRIRRRARALVPSSPVAVRPTTDAVAALLGPVLAVLGRGARAQRRADAELPSMLDQVTRQLRAGAALPVALQAACTGRTEASSAALAADLSGGAPFATSVERWHDACPTPARGLAAAALGLAAEAGGSVASVLDGVTDTLRDRVALEREVAALSSQARASAAVLVVAPVLFAVLAAGADHRVAEVLLGGPLGWACLAAGAVLDGLGALWMSRLVGRSR